MFKMPIVDLLARGREIAARGERVSVLWQEPDRSPSSPRPRVPFGVSRQSERRGHAE